MKDGRALTEKSAKPNGSSGRLTGSAPSPHLKNRPLRREAGLAGGLPHGVAELVVIDVRRVTALIADQKNTVVQTFRMGVGDIGVGTFHPPRQIDADRSEENTSELQSLMRISYAVFCLQQKTTHHRSTTYKQALTKAI